MPPSFAANTRTALPVSPRQTRIGKFEFRIGRRGPPRAAGRASGHLHRLSIRKGRVAGVGSRLRLRKSTQKRRQLGGRAVQAAELEVGSVDVCVGVFALALVALQLGREV